MAEALKVEKVAAVVLAAGQGTRMKSNLPKVMHLLNRRPLVDYVVANVENSNCSSKPVVVVSKQHHLIQDYLGERADYAIQAEPLGTAHAVGSAESLLKGKVDQVVVLYGDMPFVSSASINKLLKKQVAEKNCLTLLTVRVPDFIEWRSPFRSFGRIVRNKKGDIERSVEYKNADEEILRIKELNPCIYCFNSNWLWDNLKKIKNENTQGEYYLTDLITLAIKQGNKISSVNVEPREVIGINSKEDLKVVGKLID